MRPEDFDVIDVIEALRGTTSAIEDHLPDHMVWGDLTELDHATIDAEIFLCDICGWWCDTDEQSTSDEICTGCYDNPDEYQEDEE